jgi:soluble lytic murein transglycosylase-like protein
MADALSDEALVELIKSIAAKSRVPGSLLYAQVHRESKGQPDAIGDQGRARGLMQLHPGAAKEAGFTHDEMFDPAKNVEAGAEYLAQQLSSFSHDPNLAVSAYNAGPGNVRKVGGVTPSSAGYLKEVKSRVADAVKPGGPFEGDAVPLPEGSSSTMSIEDILDRDRITRIVNQLLGGSNVRQ